MFQEEKIQSSPQVGKEGNDGKSEGRKPPTKKRGLRDEIDRYSWHCKEAGRVLGQERLGGHL